LQKVAYPKSTILIMTNYEVTKSIQSLAGLIGREAKL
ncbi:unnamed protein product, partial [marine sediment metagenome]